MLNHDKRNRCIHRVQSLSPLSLRPTDVGRSTPVLKPLEKTFYTFECWFVTTLDVWINQFRSDCCVLSSSLQEGCYSAVAIRCCCQILS